MEALIGTLDWFLMGQETETTTANTTVETEETEETETLTYDIKEGRSRVENFLDMLRIDYEDSKEDFEVNIDFDDWLDNFDIMSEYAHYWLSEVTDNGYNDYMDLESQFSRDCGFGLTHKMYDLSWHHLKNESFETRCLLYHGSPFKFNKFQKHVHDIHHAAAVETGYSTTVYLADAYAYACQMAPGVDDLTGIEYGTTRYIYNFDLYCKVVDMNSLREAWELEPYKDMLLYLGIQAVHIADGKETVILDEALMSEFTVDSIEWEERKF